MVKAASDLFFSGARCVATSLWVKTIALRAGLFGDSVRPTFIHIFSHRTRKKKKKKNLLPAYGRFGVGRLSLALRSRSHHISLLAALSRLIRRCLRRDRVHICLISCQVFVLPLRRRSKTERKIDAPVDESECHSSGSRRG